MPGDTSAEGAAPSAIMAELAAAGFEDARQVGRGGAGVIYRCYERALGRSVAVKVLPSHLDEEDSRERFLREGYAMGGLSGHPNIVHILRVGMTTSNRPYIVMPYHPADSLAVRLRHEGPIPWPEALRIGVKLCGALETAHRNGTLHRDIKPANVLINDYGEPQLSDFGIAHIEGGYETATGFFSGTIDYTAPEVMTGNPATVAADIYSLGATIYALIAGNAAHERRKGEDLIAQYLRISSTGVPDMRTEGIPDTVCAAIEKAMSIEPANRPITAEEFGHDLQAAQRANGLKPDAMAITRSGDSTGRTAIVTPTVPVTSPNPTGNTRQVRPPEPPADSHTSVIGQPVGPPGDSSREDPSEIASILRNARGAYTQPQVAHPPATGTGTGTGDTTPPGKPARAKTILSRPATKKGRLVMAAAIAAVLLLVAGGVFVAISGDDSKHNTATSQPPTQAPVQWKPITNARTARDGTATTQSDGTIWIFGGIGSDGSVTARHEGYDPAIDEWKGGDDLPVPVQRAAAVTWQGNPVVLGGWKTAGPKPTANDQVWRMINSHWVELPRLLQPRGGGAAAVVGDRIIVTGGVDANGALLNTTEVFDGNAWTLGTPIPTPRESLAAATDGKLVYTVGGASGSTDSAAVEAYDPAAKTWATLPPLPRPRSDLGVAIADGRLVVAGGLSGGEVLKSVSVFDLTAKSWDALPDMAAARHGMAVAAVTKTVYAIGGSTGAGDQQVVSSAEALTLPARKTQPASQWRTLPDAKTPRLMMAWTVLNDRIWMISGLLNGTVLNTVESYDPRSGVWETGPPLPVALHHATAATYRGEVVVLGGATDNIADASKKVFALRGNNWVELPPLTHPRAGAAAAVVGDKLVVVGGQNAKQVVPQTEVFDGTSWNDSANMPTPREHLAAVSDGTYVYTVGGRFLSADKNSAAFERYDPASGAWTKLVDMPTPRGSYGATYIDGRVVAVGGEEPTRVLATVESYDVAEGKWSTLTPMPTARHGEAVATVGQTIYVIGGANRPSHEGGTATVEALDFN
ncbi:serine/threonine-protein kinase [Mycobacterium asiaticum]|uniref:Protein kinase n=1 Tax=Mycobacterium asiaticum TaxID=1790 RepID=A0A1A3NFJ2_MYCAS|nr:serine/threonine-protein kinase [Mycobacterium asiaticum]OBK19819.1 protein kinase [Mycobacterium asiaticum]